MSFMCQTDTYFQEVISYALDSVPVYTLCADKRIELRCVSESIGTIAKALKKQLVIPDWPMFVSVITDIFESCRKFKDGKVRSLCSYVHYIVSPSR